MPLWDRHVEVHVLERLGVDDAVWLGLPVGVVLLDRVGDHSPLPVGPLAEGEAVSDGDGSDSEADAEAEGEPLHVPVPLTVGDLLSVLVGVGLSAGLGLRLLDTVRPERVRDKVDKVGERGVGVSDRVVQEADTDRGEHVRLREAVGEAVWVGTPATVLVGPLALRDAVDRDPDQVGVPLRVGAEGVADSEWEASEGLIVRDLVLGVGLSVGVLVGLAVVVRSLERLELRDPVGLGLASVCVTDQVPELGVRVRDPRVTLSVRVLDLVAVG